MRRNSLSITVGVLGFAIVLSGSSRADTIGAGSGAVYSGFGKSLVGKAELLANPAPSFDPSRASIGSRLGLDRGGRYSLHRIMAKSIVLKDQPSCHHNCEVPEPSSVIFLATGLVAIAIKTRYGRLRRA